MSEDERIGHLREVEGFKARKKGDSLHEGASKEFKEGFTRTSVGFGSNIQPRNFGRGGQTPSDWNCVCGNLNKGRIRYLVAGREVCGSCRQERKYVDKGQLNGFDD